MCELFGMSASHPQTAAEALAEFRLRGGVTADNRDGWGLAHRGRSRWHLAKEPVPAAGSARLARLARSVHSSLIIAHLRKAKYPPIPGMLNTHPFQRVCCGQQWVFAHNGLVPAVVALERDNGNPVCHPRGETDSEYAFCHLLGGIARQFGDAAPGQPGAWFQALAAVSELVASFGQFNFLMSDGEHLIAYGHDRLHFLEQESGDGTRSALVASEPLGDHTPWRAFDPGGLRIYRGGTLVAQVATRAPRPAIVHRIEGEASPSKPQEAGARP